MTFGEQCILVRTKLLLTQRALAQELGVSVVTISRWEKQNIKPQVSQYGKFIIFCKKIILFLIQKQERFVYEKIKSF